MKYKADNYPISIDQGSDWSKVFRFPFDGTGFSGFACAVDSISEVKQFDFTVEILSTTPELRVKISVDSATTIDLEFVGFWDLLLISSNNAKTYRLKGPITLNKTFTRVGA